MNHLPWLDPEDPEQPFPPPDTATKKPNGLLAVGGDLHPRRLLNAYLKGIFPWYEQDQPILWWSPDPRAILFIREFKLRRSLRKRLRHAGFRFSMDQFFPEVIRACAGPRRDQQGTWITPSIEQAYLRLHWLGYAHSIEVHNERGKLIGGLYGVAIGHVFFGESMFSYEPDASKAALATLARQLQKWGFEIIDCQQSTQHLISLGAREIPRSEFMEYLSIDCAKPFPLQQWKLELYLQADSWLPDQA